VQAMPRNADMPGGAHPVLPHTRLPEREVVALASKSGETLRRQVLGRRVQRGCTGEMKNIGVSGGAAVSPPAHADGSNVFTSTQLRCFTPGVWWCGR